MASKRIDELDARVVADADLLPVTPSGGPSGKATVAAIVAEGLSQPNSASAGAGASITIKAADGVTSGAGGSITITPGAQATTGGPGKVVIDTLTVGRGASGVATNTAVGVSALAAVTNGTNNSSIGYGSGIAITTGSSNTTIGSDAGRTITTQSNNTAVGNSALLDCKGTSNTAVGQSCGQSLSTGTYNTYLGWQASYSGTTNGFNVIIGAAAGHGLTTNCNYNVIVGQDAARNHANGSTVLTTTVNSIYIGYAVRGLNNSDSNSIVIGYIAIGEGANTAVIGNSSTVQQHFYATRYIKTEGSLVFASSTPAAITANQNDYVLTGSAFQRLNCTTASDITGIAPPTGGAHVDGRMIRLVSVGTATVTLKHNDAASTAANRVYMHAGNHTALTVNEWADLVYDSTDNGSGAAGWRLVKYA
jgi:hypothetical protein